MTFFVPRAMATAYQHPCQQRRWHEAAAEARPEMPFAQEVLAGKRRGSGTKERTLEHTDGASGGLGPGSPEGIGPASPGEPREIGGRFRVAQAVRTLSAVSAGMSERSGFRRRLGCGLVGRGQAYVVTKHGGFQVSRCGPGGWAWVRAVAQGAQGGGRPRGRVGHPAPRRGRRTRNRAGRRTSRAVPA